MLVHLRVENFALIDHLELEFGEGLHVLTGETGAGKSIILDAIDGAVGGKVSAQAVRSGAERAVLEATFRATPELRQWLEREELGLENPEQELFVCSREISSRGNRTRINGIVVNRQQIQALREQLIEITAQGQTWSLGKEQRQRDWLDSFGGQELIAVKKRVSELFSAVTETREILGKRQKQEQERLQQLDLWQYQLQEIRSAQISDPNELEQLEQEQLKLSHTVELQQKSYQLYQILYENDSETACADLLGKGEMLLREMVAIDPQLSGIYDLVSSALAQVEEAGRAINQYGMSIEADPDRLDYVESRIRKLKQICRKYGASLSEVIAYEQKLQQELCSLQGDTLSVAAITEKLQQQEQELLAACQELTHLRQQSALQLEAQLIPLLKALAMDKVRFQVQITPKPPQKDGADHICFLFSANPGEPLQALADIASGGEMSRFFLALKTCLAPSDAVSTLIFDEIDAGVSGRVAQAIAKQLWRLSRHRQVLCVTHQPIIAAIADRHFHVTKTVQGDRTTVRVELLDQEQRKQELADIASGMGETSSAIAFAESLLEQANQLKTHDTPSPTPRTTAKPSQPSHKRTRASQQSG
jgi:DNA repair protein RecN (Recombination protein N)